LNAYEPSTTRDGDADAEELDLGITGGLRNSPNADRGSLIFLETLTDIVIRRLWTTTQRAEYLQRVVAHEIGHQFHIADQSPNEAGHNNLYYYDDVKDLTISPQLLPMHLDIIRSWVAGPGK
jgi:hypothetical protein